MWETYGSAPGTVFIQTTYQKLASETVNDMFIGMVKYIDYFDLSSQIPGVDTVRPFLFKRREYRNEQEVRLIAPTKEPYHRTPGFVGGVEISTIIESIRIRPKAEQWEFETVQRLIKKYEWDIELQRSSIDAKPLY